MTTRLKKRWAGCRRAAWRGDRRRGEVGELGQDLGADRLPGALQVAHRLGDQAQSLDRVLAPDRQRRHHRRDPVAERAVLLVGADADRNHRPQLEPLGVVAACAQVVAERAGDDREDDVVDRAAVLVLDALQRRRGRPAAKAKRRWGPISTLKGVRGRRHPGADDLAGRADSRAATWRGPRSDGADAADDLARAGARARAGHRRAAGVGRLRARRPLRGRAPAALGLAVEIEEDGGDVDAGDAVDERVVALADDREALALEPLDQPQLPERLGAVELLGEDPRRQVAQLLLGARRRQRGLADVVVEVEVRVVDPDRPALVEGDEAQLLAEARHQVQPRVDVVAELRVARAPGPRR